ncbi:MAG: tRNA pseudouridine(38-40) synthase TruA [Acidimicrobiia bacterium]|nr:tRNA pseudouridine(38-40) synthase TruA [Acidimicrobiia bacterium]
MPVYRIDFSYDGTKFHGYARQDNARTVQGELEAALGKILARRDRPPTSVAGRTDAGTHARHQVASLAWLEPIDTASLAKSLNTILGPEVSVSSVTEADGDFDARYSAKSRTYRYRILDTAHADPFRARYVWHIDKALDIDAMNSVLKPLIGPHDFASFCRDRLARGTDREIHSARWSRREDELELEITARAFCHQMVRSIVAVCVEAGRGRLAAADVEAMLEARDRTHGKGVAPAHGLTLWSVDY